jgi:hypothetical protein
MKSILLSLLAALTVAAPAYAQRREHERVPFHTPHMVFDDRFHHNHYYPVPGYSMSALPAGHLAINYRGGRFFYHSGVWFQAAGPGFVVVRPPRGVLVPVLPPAYTTVWVGNAPYYYANDVYYTQAPGGYVVADPPMAAATAPAEQAPPPQAAAPAPGGTPSGTWYYCDSSKTYYPYASECKEGWRSVPAAPPPSR